MAMAWLAPDFTVRRAVPKVGRNDPCLCGSGKKFKRCCEGEAQKRLADPSPVPGVTMAEYRARPELMTLEDFEALDPEELAAVNPARLPTMHVITAVRRLSWSCLWGAAERAMDALATRRDCPMGCDPDEYREELIYEALREGETEVAKRQFSRMKDPHLVSPATRLELDLLEPRADVLERVDQAIRNALRSPCRGGTMPALADIAGALCRRAPGLGILVARGAIGPAGLINADVLVKDIDCARDRLGLPTDDTVEELVDLLENAAGWNDAGDEEDDEHGAERRRLEAEANALRRRLADAEKQVRALEGRVAEGKDQIRAARQAAAARSPAPDAQVAQEDEGRRLRAKIGELKAIIDEGRRERLDLRAQLQALARPAARDEGRREPPARAREDLLEEGEPAPAPEGQVLLPVFARAAEDELRRAPAAVQRTALRVAAALAAGDPRAWSEAKKLEAREGLLSGRAGIHYRLLFRIDRGAGRLDIVAFTHRQGLDTAIKRFRR